MGLTLKVNNSRPEVNLYARKLIINLGFGSYHTTSFVNLKKSLFRGSYLKSQAYCAPGLITPSVNVSAGVCHPEAKANAKG